VACLHIALLACFDDLSHVPTSLQICFVGDEGFRDLSRVDTQAPRLLEEAIEADKSVECE
jgi:hypothetical protein